MGVPLALPPPPSWGVFQAAMGTCCPAMNPVLLLAALRATGMINWCWRWPRAGLSVYPELSDPGAASLGSSPKNRAVNRGRAATRALRTRNKILPLPAPEASPSVAAGSTVSRLRRSKNPK